MKDTMKDGWIAKLELHFSRSKAKTFLSKRKHSGPLMIQRLFYPEGDLCHLYLLHPPGGVVGGDQLSIEVRTDANSNSLITTPGATKIYRSSNKKLSIINQNFVIAENSSLEWLPMEVIIFPGAESIFSTKFSLVGNAQLAAWEVQCLGRPTINELFNAGNLKFSFELWKDGIPIIFEKMKIDQFELDNIVGLRGYPVFGTFVISNTDKDILNLIRNRINIDAEYISGVTQIEGITIIRCLGNKAHLVQEVFRKIWKIIRPIVFQREPSVPRIWAT